jgi:1-deoxy-D-xylulose-5-phosphate reductoisomerase
MKAQMGLPDMKLPIQYALGFPKRLANDFPRFDFKKNEQLSFEEPDLRTFRNLALATQALQKGGNLPCIMNAANEIAVWAFLKNRIGFLDMMAVVEQAMQAITFIEKPTLNDYFDTDAESREFAASVIKL